MQLLASNGVLITKRLGPKELTGADLERKIKEIVEKIHDAWSRAKFLDGWKYNEVTDKPNKLHRDLIPFDLLMKLHPEDAAYDFDTVKGAISAVNNAGYRICLRESHK